MIAPYEFLLSLDDATRALVEAHEIIETAAASLGKHLRVNRCAYADVHVCCSPMSACLE